MSKSKPSGRTPSGRKTTNIQKSKPTHPLLLGLGLLLVAVVVAAAALLLRQPTPAASGGKTSLPDEVSVAEAANLRDQGAFILDVRTPEEWAEYHLPGSTLIPVDELEARVNEVPRDQQVVVVCRSGNRSAVGRDILKTAGFGQVTSLAGGLKAWNADGLETVKGP
jgi:rhodanese-related sulfurtransferase